MSPETSFKKTAIIVIHGIGEQNPFDTLDSFARGLVNDFTNRGFKIKLNHLLNPRTTSAGTSWIESSLRITAEKASGYIDVHEYYWAHMTEEEISFSEVMQWLRKTLSGAKTSFDEFKVAFGLKRKGWRSYWWRLNSIIWHLKIFFGFATVLMSLGKLVQAVFPWSRKIYSFTETGKRFASPIVVGYVGDIAIYTTMDQKSRHFKLRNQIIAESVALTKAILSQKDELAQTYDRVILAGHSLGSVIAYDTLSKFNLDSSLPNPPDVEIEKIKGLITFGSPLDKIAFFFREHVGKDQYLRRQILDQLHSFRAKWAPGSLRQSLAPQVSATLIDAFPDLPWTNYFDQKDPISGHLEFYTHVKNIRLEVPENWPSPNSQRNRAVWGVAHIKYWEDPKFFESIVNEFNLT